MKLLIAGFIILFSSASLAVQTLQQCKDGLFNPSLRDKVCKNHATHFFHNVSHSTGILLKNKHYLYNDKTGDDLTASGLEGLAKNLKATLGSNAETLLDINNFHELLASAVGDHWSSLNRLIGYAVYPIPRIEPLKLLISISFPDVITPGTTFTFNSPISEPFALQNVQLHSEACGGIACSYSPKTAPPPALQARLTNRKLGASLSAMKFGVGAEAYTEELECLFRDGLTRKVVLVCPYLPKQRDDTSSKKRVFPSIWPKLPFHSSAYARF